MNPSRPDRFKETREILARTSIPEQELRLLLKNVTRNTLIAENLEIAGTSARRSKGLLGRNSLAPGGGLWIAPCESVHTFGMRFPIDLVYLDRSFEVKKVKHSVGPWRMSMCLSAHSILELPTGVIQSSRTQPGDILDISLAASLSRR